MAIYETTWHKRERELTTNDAGVLLAKSILKQPEYDPETMQHYLVCDVCNMPTLRPEHAHYKCTNCGARTSCCEGS